MFGAYRGCSTGWRRRDWDRPVPALLPAGAAGGARAGQRHRRARVGATAARGRSSSWAARDPDRPALLWGEDDRLSATASWPPGACGWPRCWQSTGVAAGEPVAVSLPKGPEQVVAVLGVLARAAPTCRSGSSSRRQRRDRIYARAGVRLALGGTTRRALSASQAAVLAPHPRAAARRAGRAGVRDLHLRLHRRAQGRRDPHRAARQHHRGPQRSVSASAAPTGCWRCRRWTSTCRCTTSSGCCRRAARWCWSSEDDRREARRWVGLVAAARRDGRGTPCRRCWTCCWWRGRGHRGRRRPARWRCSAATGSGWTCRAGSRQRGPGAGCVALGGATEAAIWSNLFEVGEVPAHLALDPVRRSRCATAVPGGRWPRPRLPRLGAGRAVDRRRRGGARLPRRPRHARRAQFVERRRPALVPHRRPGPLLARRHPRVPRPPRPPGQDPRPPHRAGRDRSRAADAPRRRPGRRRRRWSNRPAALGRPRWSLPSRPPSRAGPPAEAELRRHLPTGCPPTWSRTGSRVVDAAAAERQRQGRPASGWPSGSCSPAAAPPRPRRAAGGASRGDRRRRLGRAARHRPGRPRGDSFFALGGDSLLATRLLAPAARRGPVRRRASARCSPARRWPTSPATLTPGAPGPPAAARPPTRSTVTSRSRRRTSSAPTGSAAAGDFTLGGVGSHWYWEFDGDRCRPRPPGRRPGTGSSSGTTCCARCSTSDGRQRDPARRCRRFRIPVTHRARGRRRRARALRDRLSHRVPDPARWPLFRRAVRRYVPGGADPGGVQLRLHRARRAEHHALFVGAVRPVRGSRRRAARDSGSPSATT